MLKRAGIVLVPLMFVVIFGIVGRMDMEDEIRSQVHYCDMVEKGAWPDYNQTYKDCDKAREAFRKYVAK